MPENSTASLEAPQWTVVGIKDEWTGDLSYEFTVPVGDGSMASLELNNDLSYRQMAQRLARRTTLLPKANAAKFVEDLVTSTAGKFIIKARQPGWKNAPASTTDSSEKGFTAFVTPGQIIGPGSANYRRILPAGSRPYLGQSAGDLEAWFTSIGSLAEQSNYIAFAIMFALAGPLLAFVDLPEDPAFNWFGGTSVGKTTGAKAGASVLGHPNAIRNWGLSERGLEETCADHNDLMTVLNAAEKASLARRRELLNRIIHMVSERESTVRSAAVQEQLPNLTWRTGLLSTSNRSGAQMAAEAGLSWGPQEAVRFIDIPVPPAEEGGIFDRLGKIQDKAAKGTELIRQLERDLQQSYGVLLRPWIEHLLATDPGVRVAELIARFDKKTGPHRGLEDRIARKFGLLYAAGKMAVQARLLKWPSGLPLSATKTLLHRATETRELGDPRVRSALKMLTHALQDPSQIRPVTPGQVVKISDPTKFLGVRYRQGGKDLVGLRKEGLPALVGITMVKPLLASLRELGAAVGGHGGKSTQQLPITLKIGGETHSKPRFLMIDPHRLA